MFSPRETFRTIENFFDHVIEVVESKFRSTESKIEADFAILRGEMQDEIANLKANCVFLDDRCTALAKELLHAGIVATEPTPVTFPVTPGIPVNTPPAISQAPIAPAGSPE